jgi:hypothetical protein
MLDIRKEIEFWTQIMRDHGEFQYLNLSINEVEVIRTAINFRNWFDKLNMEVKSISGELSPSALSNLISTNEMAVTQFIEFKKMMLKRLMKCDIQLGMTPSFLNHMINEALEFYRVLNIAQGAIPLNRVLENIRLHKVWLPDAAGHASAIAAELDAIESLYVNTAQEFAKKFNELFKKAFEMYKMFERTGIENGGLHHFNREVEETLESFIVFLNKVEKLRMECKVYSTGMVLPLLPNHMIREEKYYIYRIESSTL